MAPHVPLKLAKLCCAQLFPSTSSGTIWLQYTVSHENVPVHLVIVIKREKKFCRKFKFASWKDNIFSGGG